MGEHCLTLIIPTCGRPHDLDICLQSIEESAGPALAQVIVVDDAPQAPATVPQRIAGAEVTVWRNSRPIGAAASRNKALDMLQPEVNAVGFLDDDVRLPCEWFTVVLAELTPKRGAITGPVQRFDTGLVARARQLRYDARYRQLRSRQKVDFLAGGNVVIWRGVLEHAGYFPETATMSDVLLARRLGGAGAACYFIPELRVLHRNSKGVRQASLAAWQAGVIEGQERTTTTYVRRVASAMMNVPNSRDPPAAALNVALDALFLTGHATGRVSLHPSPVLRNLPPMRESAAE